MKAALRNVDRETQTDTLKVKSRSLRDYCAGATGTSTTDQVKQHRVEFLLKRFISTPVKDVGTLPKEFHPAE